jgi:outer membrane protein OmpA-like peptidoglycan-associated protein/Tol biopolymer transport system component
MQSKFYCITCILCMLSLTGLFSQSTSSNTANQDYEFRNLQRQIAADLVKNDWGAALGKMLIYEEDYKDYPPFYALKKLLQAPETGIKKEKLKGSINSDADENTPVLTTDEKAIFFCSDDRPDNLGGEDIYQASLHNGEWGEIQLVESLSNPKLNDAPLSISADGTRLFLFVDGKIAYSDKTAEDWTPIQFLPAPLNEKTWQSDAQMTADGRALLLTIRDDNNDDLYVSVIQDDGSWGVPKNLGPVINTPGMERTPLLHPDMKTLYFSSQGHGSMGGLDVYKSTRLDDSWTEWSTPVNVGKEINTPGNDWGYSVSTDGTYAVFSAVNDGQEDLYKIELPKDARPEPVTLISGSIEGLKPGKSADVLLYDDQDKLIGKHRSDPSTGKYLIILPSGLNPTVKIEGEGIVSAPKKLNIQQEEGKAVSEVSETITVADLSEVEGKEEVSFTFEDVLFETDQYELKTAFFPAMNNIAAIIAEKQLRVTIEGHTDNTGNAAYNQSLSLKRAKAVQNYLMAKGVEATQIKVAGLGEEQPIASNDTPEGRAKNRRVELKFRKN